MASVEHLVVEGVLVVAVPGLVEVVHVELPDEGGEVIVLEVAGEDAFYEIWQVFNHEGLAIFRPFHDLIILRVLKKR